MNPLPQRKKTAEEIAKLRESLGIPPSPGEVPVEPPPVEVPSVVPAPSIEPELPAATPEVFAPPVEPDVAIQEQPAEILEGEAAQLPPVPILDVSGQVLEPFAQEPRRVKTVRSLKKSEQGPVMPRDLSIAPADAKIPMRRHSEDEIMEMRRRDLLAAQSPAQHMLSLAASPFLIGAGYLVAVAGAVCAWRLFSPVPGGVCVGVALLVAAWIALRKPISRHHAGFIFMIAMFTAVFGAIHHFPTEVVDEPVAEDPNRIIESLSVDDGYSSLTDEEKALILELKERTKPVPDEFPDIEPTTPELPPEPPAPTTPPGDGETPAPDATPPPAEEETPAEDPDAP
jgi:hypothetical protein